MIRTLLAITVAVMTMTGCTNSKGNKMTDDKTAAGCSDECMAKTTGTNLTCKLTTAEMQARKATVLESLRKQTLEKKRIA